MHDNESAEQRSFLTEIDFMVILRDIWSAKFTIACAVAFGIVFALVSLAFAPRTYTAQALLGPAESSAQGGLTSSLGQIAGAASLLGVNFGPAATSDFGKFKALLTSERLAEVLYENDALKPTFFGPGWVPKTRTWKRPTGLMFNFKNFLKGILGLPQWKPPVASDLREDLKRHLDVVNDKFTGYTTVTISENSPGEAVNILRAIILTADNLMREGVKERAAGRISYLRDVLQQTTIQDQRQVIIDLLSAQEKTMMTTSADKTYAVDIIDPASASPIPTSPQPTSTVMSMMLFATLISTLWAVVRGQFFARGSLGASDAARDSGLDSAVYAFLYARWKKLISRRGGATSLFHSASESTSER